jgi:hypothetical protein
MDPWKYAVEVENQRVLKLPNNYYHGFSEANLYFKSYDYNYTDTGVLVHKSNDWHRDKRLMASLDFNTDIVWGLACQTYGKEFRVINAKFVKPKVTQKEQEASIILQLAAWFDETYSSGLKEIEVYGDPNGNSTSASTDLENKPFFDKFCDYLQKKGWKVFRKESHHYPPRKERYELINRLLSGSDTNAPNIKINKNTCKDFIIALQNTLVTVDKMYKKDKKSEKSARFREHATDSTDAFDYILYTLYSSLIKKSRGFRHR